MSVLDVHLETKEIECCLWVETVINNVFSKTNYGSDFAFCSMRLFVESEQVRANLL